MISCWCRWWETFDHDRDSISRLANLWLLTDCFFRSERWSGGERGARGGEWVQGGASVPNCYLPLLNLQKTQWNYGAGPKDHQQAPTVDNSLPPPSSGQDKQTPNPILSLPITFLIWNTSASDCWQLVVLKNSQHSCSKQGGGEGVKGRLNNVKKICTIGEGRLP